MLADRN